MEEIEKDLIDIAAVLDNPADIPADNTADIPASEDLDEVIDSKISEMEEILDDDTETEIDTIEMAPEVEDSAIENPNEANEVIDEIEEIVDDDLGGRTAHRIVTFQSYGHVLCLDQMPALEGRSGRKIGDQLTRLLFHILRGDWMVVNDQIAPNFCKNFSGCFEVFLLQDFVNCLAILKVGAVGVGGEDDPGKLL